MGDESHAALPRWALLGRSKWVNTGATRPPFAVAPGEGQESVWDYPRPPRLVGDDRRVEVRLDGVTIADSRLTARVLETSHPPSFYVPRSDVDTRVLSPADGGSLCEWKGEATYWDVEVRGRRVSGRVWSYEKPFGEFASIAGHLSFYPSHFECFVDGRRVEPQPGGFYGGWITTELVGPFKGAAGSGGW